MSGQKTILLIDDEEDFCFFVKAHLEKTGAFQVRTAHSGNEGIREAKTLGPDLILLDIVMPDLSGDEVAMEFSEDPATRDIPVVFLTALASQEGENGSSLQKIGGRYFIAKPITRDGLMEAINAVLSPT